ncbi:hypothetical protein BH20BAC1_BH20BAC1_03400 [soil metagenome]
MHPYIPHLLADIAAAHRDENAIPQENHQSIETHLEEVDRWINGEMPEHTFGYYCGLRSIDFPPPEQLTIKEMKLVCRAFEHLLFTWNSGIDLPKKLPVRLRYQFTVDTLNQEIAIVNSGFMTFDYCSGNAPDCIFKEYCPCLEIWNNPEDDDMEVGNFSDDEPPF